MKTEAVLTITDDGEPVISVKYTSSSELPLRCGAMLELSDFLDAPDGLRGIDKDRYLYAADSIYSLIVKYHAEDKLDDYTYDRLRMLSLVYKGMKNEHLRLKRLEYLRLKQCDVMLSAAFRISSIIKNRSFENLTAGDCDVMKRYLISSMPDKYDLADYPKDMQEKIRPFFGLLRLLIEISPSQADKAMIDETMHCIYGDNF